MLKGDKLEKHEKALQETQLVKVKNKETLEGKVDIQKVKEIRRAIRRRYGNRTNFHKIFNSWDRHHKGYIDLSDLHYMVNKLGIKINAPETKVLLASHDLSGNKKLMMDEFLNLIFSPDDNMNVDLSKIPFGGNLMEIEPNEDIMQGIQKDAAKLKRIKEENQFKYMLQKSLKDMHKEWKEADKDQTSEIDYETFEKVLQAKVRLPAYMRERKDLFQAVFHDFESKQSGKMNYQRFLESVKAFQYMGETDLNIDLGPATSDPYSEKAKAPDATPVDKKPMVIQNVQKVPGNQLELIVDKTLKVSRILQAKFGTAEQFDKELKAKVKFDKYGNASAADLEAYFVEVCKPNLIKREIGRRDLEGFLSSLTYNNYRMTDMHGIAPYVFSDDTEISKKIHSIHRPMPPPAALAEKFLESVKGQESAEPTKPAEPTAAAEATESEPRENEANATRMRELVKELHQKSFADKKYIYHVFKDYDRDGDGTSSCHTRRLRFLL